jgi:hypothetical protein
MNRVAMLSGSAAFYGMQGVIGQDAVNTTIDKSLSTKKVVNWYFGVVNFVAVA